MTALKEENGKHSFSRIVATAIVAVMFLVLLYAVVRDQWETVRSLASELMLLAFGLYGLNRAPAVVQALNGKKETA